MMDNNNKRMSALGLHKENKIVFDGSQRGSSTFQIQSDSTYVQLDFSLDFSLSSLDGTKGFTNCLLILIKIHSKKNSGARELGQVK